MAPKVQHIPWIPDKHDDFPDIGQYTHTQLDQVIGLLLGRVATLEAELQQTRAATVKRYYVESMPAGVTEVDLAEQGVSYVPGANSLIFYGNTIKQVVGESYLEISPTRIQLTDPTIGGETFEIYALPFPFSGQLIP